MSVDTHPRLLGDIGGTNARFAWQAAPGAALAAIATLPADDHATLLDAARAYLDQAGLGAPRACGIGIANPVIGDRVQMTNRHWSFSIAELQRALGVARLAVINDFTALALSLPDLGASDLVAIGGGQAVPGAARAVIGPGTGLGVSGLLQRGARPLAIEGEGGHATLAACSAHEAAVIEQLRRRFDHVSAERALSGPGLVNLHQACAAVAGRAADALEPGDVLDRAAHDEDCRAALELFCAFLGTMAGNLALTLGARGGVYIGGGIVPRILDRLQRSDFRPRFEGKGRLRAYLAPIPTWVIAAQHSPALLGASRALDLDD
jgi:glucokinase